MSILILRTLSRLSCYFLPNFFPTIDISFEKRLAFLKEMFKIIRKEGGSHDKHAKYQTKAADFRRTE